MTSPEPFAQIPTSVFEDDGDSASDIDDDEKLDEVEFLSSEVERRECEQSAGLADDGDQALPQATSSTSGQGQEQSSGGRAGASVPTLIDLTNSGMNPGGWEKTKNMNISQKRQIYYTVITYKY